MKKALKYTGLAPGRHTDIFDARQHRAWWELGGEEVPPNTPGARFHAPSDGQPINIFPSDIVPLEAFKPGVAEIHANEAFESGIRTRGPLAIVIEVPDDTIERSGKYVITPKLPEPVKEESIAPAETKTEAKPAKK